MIHTDDAGYAGDQSQGRCVALERNGFDIQGIES